MAASTACAESCGTCDQLSEDEMADVRQAITHWNTVLTSYRSIASSTNVNTLQGHIDSILGGLESAFTTFNDGLDQGGTHQGASLSRLTLGGVATRAEDHSTRAEDERPPERLQRRSQDQSERRADLNEVKRSPTEMTSETTSES